MEIKINCEYCDRTFGREGMVDYYLIVESGIVQNKSMYSIDVMIENPFPENKYFCGKGCLKNWLNDEKLVLNNRLSTTKFNEEKNEHN